MTRSAKVKEWKDRANEKGHEMGNVVNVAPLISPGFTVRSRCRKCNTTLLIIYNKTTDSYGAEGNDALFKPCGTPTNPV